MQSSNAEQQKQNKKKTKDKGQSFNCFNSSDTFETLLKCHFSFALFVKS